VENIHTDDAVVFHSAYQRPATETIFESF